MTKGRPITWNLSRKVNFYSEQLPEQDNSFANWRKAVNKTEVSTATGSCGFGQAEVAMLPGGAIAKTMQIFLGIEPTQWRSCLVRAKVILRK